MVRSGVREFFPQPFTVTLWGAYGGAWDGNLLLFQRSCMIAVVKVGGGKERDS